MLHEHCQHYLSGEELHSHIIDSLVDKLSYGDWLVVMGMLCHFTPDVVRSVLTEVERKEGGIRSSEDR